MYLSRIELDETNRKTMMALSQLQILHAALEDCFAAKREEKSRSLWRIDRVTGRLYLLLLSHDIPDFSRFAPQFSPSSARGETKSYDPFLARIENQQRWRFRLEANPVHSVKNPEQISKCRGKIQALVIPEEQKHWLICKAENFGFAIDEAEFEVKESNLIKFNRQAAIVTLQKTVFEGTLTVERRDAFLESLTTGIGRGKAYGCGLLTIARSL